MQFTILDAIITTPGRNGCSAFNVHPCAQAFRKDDIWRKSHWYGQDGLFYKERSHGEDYGTERGAWRRAVDR